MIDRPRIAGLEIDAELGRGAHSVVYRGAFHGTPCAVKLPRAKARWTPWIYREAVSLARVKHPNLPAVLEVGEVDGLPYLVMELVEGETLADVLKRGPIEEGAALGIARQLVGVLAAVHDAGLVHRDVKPRNIVLERSTGVLKLVDFGFATDIERAATHDFAGTLGYAAPEQLRSPYDVDGRADLYAVGRVLFECLTGARFRAEAGPTGDEARAQLITAGVNDRIAEAVARLLSEARELRYPNARTFDDALGGNQAHDLATPEVTVRQSELDSIVTTFEDRAHGGLVVVVGSRGSGKTRLLQAAKAKLIRGARILSVQSREDDAPLTTLRRIVNAFATGFSESNDVRGLLGSLTTVADAITSKDPAPNNRGPDPSDVLSEGAAQLLLELTRHVGPVIVAIDDAQWMDAASAEALLRTAHRLGEAPLGLLLATRECRDDFACVRGSRTVTILALTEEQSAAVVAAYLGTAAVDEALAARIHTMADGTPLGSLEVLGAFLDDGAVRPCARGWSFDASKAARVVLPKGAFVVLGRRLAQLTANSREILEVAAVIGRCFDERLLAVSLGLTMDAVAEDLAMLRRQGLIEPDGEGRHRFVHDSVRERLREELSAESRRRLHLRVGEALDARGQLTFEDLCATARHLIAGDDGHNPARLHRVARAAGEAALQRFDNAAALSFFNHARVAATAARLDVDATFFEAEGEGHLRRGAFDASIANFESALERTNDAHQRARILGRLSWVFQSRGDPTRAWSWLERAFAELGGRMPGDDAASAARTVGRLTARKFSRSRANESATYGLLCTLHYQNARLGLENGKPVRVLQSSAECRAYGDLSGSEALRARAHAFHSFAMTTLGRRDGRVTQSAMRATALSRRADPATTAFCLQLECMVRVWRADVDDALAVARECVDVYGPWLERNEYLLDVASADVLESVRGHASRAWSWIERGLERLRRAREGGTEGEFIVHRARAALAATGRRVVDDPWLAAQLAAVSPRDGGRGFHRIVSLAARARYYLDAEELGEDFEALVRSVDNDNINPRSAHIGVVEYYVAVAQARVHQCIRTRSDERLVAKLRRASSVLTAAAKTPLFQAHARFAEGAVAFFDRQERKAARRLAEADSLAIEQNCPWVRYGVARLRAHGFRDSGNANAARDEARVAELFASEHGAVARARWVREDFGLEDRLGDASSGGDEFAVGRERTGIDWQRVDDFVDRLRAVHRSGENIEAVKTLAGVLASDVDSVLSTFNDAVSAARRRAPAAVAEELDAIADASARASELSGRLRRSAAGPRSVDAWLRAARVEVQRVAGADVEVIAEPSIMASIEIDSASFETALRAIGRGVIPVRDRLTITARRAQHDAAEIEVVIAGTVRAHLKPAVVETVS
jgi:serine/threonine protein kinase